MNKGTGRFFHLHLVSDATGETLNAVAKAATVQYASFQSIEHVHALVRSVKQLDRALTEIENTPGIVFFTLVNQDLRKHLENRCEALGVPSIAILDPVIDVLSAYLNAESIPQIGGQHVLDAEYFSRIDALNFTMAHDDGQMTEDIDTADLILVGISRTSKTPTSIYLANKGVKTANIPLVPNIPLPPQIEKVTKPLVVCLIASTERIIQIRRNRLLSLNQTEETEYIDRSKIAEELKFARTLCARNNWPIVDVTRRSIEETAAGILNLLSKRNQIETL